MADLISKCKRILQAVDLYHEAPNSTNRTELRRVIHAELESAGALAIRELENIVRAQRFNREHFDDDTAFADWAQSRARHTLAACDASHACIGYAPYCHSDGENCIAGEFRMGEFRELPFEVSDPDHWGCRAVYLASANVTAAKEE